MANPAGRNYAGAEPPRLRKPLLLVAAAVAGVGAYAAADFVLLGTSDKAPLPTSDLSPPEPQFQLIDEPGPGPSSERPSTVIDRPFAQGTTDMPEVLASRSLPPVKTAPPPKVAVAPQRPQRVPVPVRLEPDFAPVAAQPQRVLPMSEPAVASTNDARKDEVKFAENEPDELPVAASHGDREEQPGLEFAGAFPLDPGTGAFDANQLAGLDDGVPPQEDFPEGEITLGGHDSMHDLAPPASKLLVDEEVVAFSASTASIDALAADQVQPIQSGHQTPAASVTLRASDVQAPAAIEDAVSLAAVTDAVPDGRRSRSIARKPQPDPQLAEADPEIASLAPAQEMAMPADEPEARFLEQKRSRSMPKVGRDIPDAEMLDVAPEASATRTARRAIPRVEQNARLTSVLLPVQIGGVRVGSAPLFLLNDDQVAVHLASLLDLISPRMDEEDYTRLRASRAAGDYVLLERLREAGIVVGYDTVHDELVLSAR